jgi:hypothetical protein
MPELPLSNHYLTQKLKKLAEILEAAGSNFSSHNPETWPKQAGLAAEGKWDELKEWQDELNGGRE